MEDRTGGKGGRGRLSGMSLQGLAVIVHCGYSGGGSRLWLMAWLAKGKGAWHRGVARDWQGGHKQWVCVGPCFEGEAGEQKAQGLEGPGRQAL